MALRVAYSNPMHVIVWHLRMVILKFIRFNLYTRKRTVQYIEMP